MSLRLVLVLVAALLLHNPSLVATAEHEAEALMVLGKAEDAERTLGPLLARQPELWPDYLEALAHVGDVSKLLEMWEVYRAKQKPSEHVMEEVAWGLIHHDARASSIVIRQYALLSAFFARDAYAVDLVKRGMTESNPQLRALAAQLAGKLRDAPLRQLLIERFSTERQSAVRRAVITALAQAQEATADSLLVERLNSAATSLDERMLLVQALAALREEVSEQEIRELLQSRRSGLQLLGCVLAVQHEVDLDSFAWEPALESHTPEVRAAAAGALAQLAIERTEIFPLSTQLEAREPLTALTAIWALFSWDARAASERLRPWLSSARREHRLLAAAVLRASGAAGRPMMSEALDSHEDLFVRANAALGLMRQGERSERVYRPLVTLLTDPDQRLAWRRPTLYGDWFETLVPADDVREYSPQEADFRTRLDLLSLLAAQEHPAALSGLKTLLQRRQWGTLAQAGWSLLMHNERRSLPMLRALLQDTNSNVRIQAALLLAVWEGSDAAVDVLMAAYPDGDRMLKEMILEGLITANTERTRGFFLDQWRNPHASLRLIAALGILVNLNH